MATTQLTSTEIDKLERGAWLTPGSGPAFRTALAARDFQAALACCRSKRADDLVGGALSASASPEITAYSPRWTLFAELTDFLTDKEYFPLLGTAWVELDDKRVQPEAVELLFRPSGRDAANQSLVMNGQERCAFDALPASFEVFRGCTRDTAENCSWSRDFAKAKHFSKNFAGPIIDRLSLEDQTPVVLRANCRKHDVLALFTRWGEEEIVVSPYRLTNKREF